MIKTVKEKGKNNKGEKENKIYNSFNKDSPKKVIDRYFFCLL